MEFKVGQIYFWNSNEDLFGKAETYFNMQTFGRSDTTHCGIIVKVEEDKVMIAEAAGKGFLVDDNFYNKVWLNQKIKEGVVHIGECNEKLKDVYENAKKYEGIGYGWLDLIVIAFSFITGFKLGLTGKNKIICSEAVNYVIYDSTKSVNIAAEYGLSPDEITPEHIFLSKQVKIL